MSTPLINILGIASSFSVEIIDVVEKLGMKYVLVDNGYKPVLSGTYIDLSDANKNIHSVLGVGKPASRQALYDDAEQSGFKLWKTLVSPLAMVANGAEISTGVFINAGAVIANNSLIERQCVINRLAGIGHHAKIGEFSFIGPGAQILGSSIIGSRTFIGAGAIVLDGVTIGDDAVIGAGSVVTKDLPSHSKAFGSPAKIQN